MCSQAKSCVCISTEYSSISMNQHLRTNINTHRKQLTVKYVAVNWANTSVFCQSFMLHVYSLYISVCTVCDDPDDPPDLLLSFT